MSVTSLSCRVDHGVLGAVSVLDAQTGDRRCFSDLCMVRPRNVIDIFQAMASCEGGDWLPVSSLTRRAEHVASDTVPVSGT
jgi:hypothetical protein